MAVVIPNVVNWSVTPQNGQEDYFTKMNIWLSESTTVIASLSTAITKINESNAESNDNLEEVLTSRDQTVAARNEAVTAVATLTAGAIDDTTIAPNKAFSNQFITNNYYKKTEVDNKINVNGFTDKATPSDTDHIGIQETGGVFKKLSWANLKATLLTYFDTLYSRTTAIFGIGQTWQDLTTNRNSNITYTNTTGKAILVIITYQHIASIDQNTIVKVDGVSIGKLRSGGGASATTESTVSFVVPNNSNYLITSSGTKISWSELR